MSYKVIIVGAGVSGLCMAISLIRTGQNDFVILEKASGLGGTWRDNVYPGCKSDIPVHSYSFSFALNPDWSRRYGPQPEILAYLQRTADAYGLMQRIQFDTTVVHARFSTKLAQWTVQDAEGTSYRASALVLGVGIVHRPAIPSLPGVAHFKGTVFHSAAWPADYSLVGKRVAVIGTGASAVQLVPGVATDAERLYVFQRTPPWILPRRDKSYGEVSRWTFRNVPAIALLYRAHLYLRAELRVLAFRRQKWLMRAGEIVARWYLRSQVADPALRRSLTPSYGMGCKSLLLSNDYFRALTRSSVELVTSKIDRFDRSAVHTTDGASRTIDTVILATGFHVVDTLDDIQVVSSDGATLKETWRDGPEAFLGICVSGFPNLFLLFGPNTGVGHNSMIFMIEAQAHYIAKALSQMRKACPVMSIDARVQRRYNSRLHRDLRRAVWSTGRCSSWYLDGNGYNRVLWPYSTVAYWVRTRRVVNRHFRSPLSGLPSRRRRFTFIGRR